MSNPTLKSLSFDRASLSEEKLMQLYYNMLRPSLDRGKDAYFYCVKVKSLNGFLVSAKKLFLLV